MKPPTLMKTSFLMSSCLCSVMSIVPTSPSPPLAMTSTGFPFYTSSRTSAQASSSSGRSLRAQLAEPAELLADPKNVHTRKCLHGRTKLRLTRSRPFCTRDRISSIEKFKELLQAIKPRCSHSSSDGGRHCLDTRSATLQRSSGHLWIPEVQERALIMQSSPWHSRQKNAL